MALLSRCPFLDVNRQDKEGDTALMLAAQAGGSLLTHPPPGPLQTGPQRHTPQGVLPPQTLQCWGGGGWGVTTPFLGPQICPRCSAGHAPLVSLLLSYYAGLDLERRDQRGLTALMKAAVRDRAECVAALLMAGAQACGDQGAWPPAPPPVTQQTPSQLS